MTILLKHCKNLGFSSLVLLLASPLVQSCTDGKASFKGSARKAVISGVDLPPEDEPQEGTVTPAPKTLAALPTPRPEATFVETPPPDPAVVDSNFSGSQQFATTVNQKEVWVVISNKAFRILIDESRGFPMRSWDIQNTAGNRTYVSEIGLLIGKTAFNGSVGGIFRVGEDTGGSGVLILRPSDIAQDSRICVTSFRADGQAYIGAAYRTTASERKVIRIPIDKTKPELVDLTRLQSVTNGTSANVYASYSCFIDQARGLFWVGGYRGAGGDLWGVDIVNMTAVDQTRIPNQGAGTNVLSLSQSSNVNYALAGDGSGNLLNAASMYTFSHEAVTDTVFGSTGSTLHVLKGECFRGTADCTAKHATYSLGVGPLSSLNDGSVVGLTRDSGDVFLIRLNDPNSVASGISARKIGAVPGDPYMYTDFTGATLYPTDAQKQIDLNSMTGFRAGISVKSLRLKWVAASGTAEEWRGLTLSVRCFLGTAATRPGFVEISPVANAGTLMDLPVPMCRGLVDTVEVKVSPSGTTSAFSRTDGITIEGVQGE